MIVVGDHVCILWQHLIYWKLSLRVATRAFGPNPLRRNGAETDLYITSFASPTKVKSIHCLDTAQRTSSKVPRTDSSDGSMMDVCCTQGTVSDSAQSNFGPPAAPAAATPAPDYAGSLPASVQQCVRHADDCSALMDAEQLVASEDFELSGSEVDGPVVVDKYIKGTRLIINGWFQACR